MCWRQLSQWPFTTLTICHCEKALALFVLVVLEESCHKSKQWYTCQIRLVAHNESAVEKPREGRRQFTDMFFFVAVFLLFFLIIITKVFKKKFKSENVMTLTFCSLVECTEILVKTMSIYGYLDSS